MATTTFIPRQEKAKWGIPCNERADGELFVGKGYQETLTRQLGSSLAADVRRAILKARGDRRGRFWLNIASRQVTMAVGESAANETKTVTF
jgi:hypothetical protein